MFNKIILVVFGASLFLVSHTVIAQDGKRYDSSVTWKNIVKINYHVGKRDSALAIIRDYYREASIKAKTPMPELVLELQTGDYDLLLVWHMEGGVNDLTWERGPNSKKWRAALNEVAGSEEKAQEILDEYLSYIDSAENDIAIVR
ncbi:MAG: hypothetical protein ACI9O6_000514 [Glaciecola sp.]|jgi:hypothetical protein